MAYLVRRRKDTNTYDSSSIEGFKITQNTDSSCTYEPFGKEYEYYVNIPRRCSRCRMYDWDRLNCKKKKKTENCRKSYSIKKKK